MNRRETSNGSPGWLRKLREEMCGLREEVGALREDIDRLHGAPEDEERLLDVDEAAEILGVSRRTCETLIHSGELSSLKIRRRRKVLYRALMAYIRRRAGEAGHES